MFTIILFVFSSVALSTCQLAVKNVGPQTFPDQSSLDSLIPDKRFVNDHGFKYIISPIQFENVQSSRPEKQQIDQQNVNKQGLLPFENFSPREELQFQKREPVKVPIYQNENPTYKNLEDLRFFNYQDVQKPRKQYQLINIQQGKQLQKEFSPITESNKDQIESDLVEQIRQQWSRIVDDNQINWRALSIVPEEKQYSKAFQTEQSTLPEKNNEENDREYARKETEDILRVKGNFESIKPNVNGAEEPNYQKSPFFIHRLVSVTKHHPVNIVKQVKVAVPTPVLVPVPESYELKVPQPYHVPVEVIRHISVPGRAH